MGLKHYHPQFQAGLKGRYFPAQGDSPGYLLFDIKMGGTFFGVLNTPGGAPSKQPQAARLCRATRDY